MPPLAVRNAVRNATQIAEQAQVHVSDLIY